MTAAQRAITAIKQSVKVMQSHPATGHLIDENPPEYREWIVPFGSSAYIVRYRFDQDQVIILAVRHGREAGY